MRPTGVLLDIWCDDRKHDLGGSSKSTALAQKSGDMFHAIKIARIDLVGVKKSDFQSSQRRALVQIELQSLRISVIIIIYS